MREVTVSWQDFAGCPTQDSVESFVTGNASMLEDPNAFVRISIVHRYPGRITPGDAYRKLLRTKIRQDESRLSIYIGKNYKFDFKKLEYQAFGKPIYLTPAEQFSLYLYLSTGVRTELFDRHLPEMRRRFGKQFLRGVVR